MKNKGRGKRDQGRGVSEEEIQEAATETPAFLGCPQHMPTHLPGGFDGVEPAQKKRSEVEKLNEILFERLGEIVKKCCAMRVECDPEHVDYDAAETNIKLFGAFSELRQMCDFYKPREKPIDPTAPEMKTQSEIQREEARQKRKIHWTCYPTKVDICVMGKTEQNGKVYEVRISKRGDSKVRDTYGKCKVNGKKVLTCRFIGSAWMLKRILTEGMQELVNYKAKRNRDSRRNYKRRDARAAAST